ncbi:MAG: HNH endonuclease signature motif containing protein [Elainellaceae cyanobacterium]
MSYISEALRRQIEQRADHRCEYCRLPNSLSFYPHEIDHVIARKHGGKTTLENLAYACWRCNRHKGSDLGSFDPKTEAFSYLFNPRTQTWESHFALKASQITGRTPEGRTTAHLLKFNTKDRIAERQRMNL